MSALFAPPSGAGVRELSVPPHVRRPEPVPRTDSPAIAALRADPSGVEEFWERVSKDGAPLVEGAGRERIFTFLYRGQAKTVALIANKMADDSSYRDVLFDNIPGTDLWSLSLRLGAGWRGSYRIAVVDGRPPEITELERIQLDRRRMRSLTVTPAERHDQIDAWYELQRHARRDPLAREQAPKSSVASGPEATAPYPLPSLAAPGRIIPVDHAAWWHVPPVEPGQAGWDVLVLLDGDRWIAGGTRVLDALALSDAMRPTATLLLGHGGMLERVSQLTCDPALVDRIRRLIDKAPAELGRLSDDPHRTTIAGQSLGGLAALYAQGIAPDRFGASICQSGSFWWPNPIGGEQAEWLTRTIQHEDAQFSRVRLEVGIGEWALSGPTRRLRAVLAARCEVLQYSEYDGGHDAACWDVSLPYALISLADRGATNTSPDGRSSQAPVSMEIDEPQRATDPRQRTQTKE